MSTKDFLQIGIDDIPMNVAVYRYVDEDFILMDFNKRAEKTEHIKKEDVLGKCLTELFPSVQESGFLDALLHVYENGEQKEFDLDLYEDGHISGWRHNSVSRLPSGDVIAFYQDIKEPQDQIQRRKSIQYELEQSEEKFQVITDNTFMGIFIYHDKYVYVNKAMSELSGYTPEEMYAMHPWEGLAESYVQKVKKIVERRLKGECFPHEYDQIKIKKKNGEIRTVRVMAQTIRYEGQYAGMGTVIDITDTQETQAQLKLLGQAIEQMDEMVRITDRNGIITYVNAAMISHTGYTKEELIGHKIGMFKSGFHHQSFYEDLWDTIMSGKTFKAVFTNRKKDKKLYYEEETITPIMDEDGVIQHFLATSQDITKRVFMEEKLQQLATVDSLTGIYNRYKTNEEIEIEIGRSNRYDENFALAMFDIDHFKKVNDTYGHEIGDYVLQEISAVVTQEIRESDRFGRWGGEEFILILPKLSKEEALHVSEKLRGKIESHDFKDVGRITISIGVSIFEPSDTKESLLKRVDNALYKAKDEGRNRVVLE
jgi:diguanylate cyclase (GGDEF)-like protein/PAS domain S-box-containing protein